MERWVHNRRLAALLLVGLLLLSGCGQHTFRGTVIAPPNPAKDISLTDQRGQPFRLSEQRGNTLAVFFGFTNCPDVCPTALGDLAAVKRTLGDDAAKLKVVFITVDPERDTPDRIGRYLALYDPAFIGLNGTSAELEQVQKAYGVTAIKRALPDSALGYTMDHSAFIYIIDAAGNLRLLFSPGLTVDDIAGDLRYIIRNQ